MTERQGSTGVAGAARFLTGQTGNVLLMSMRRVADLVAYCSYYEFEDVITAVTDADRIELGDQKAVEFARRSFKLLRYSTGSWKLAWSMAPKPPPVRLERQYELFFPVFTHAHELFALSTIPDWRKHARVAACYIAEIWLHQLPHYLIELLREFDHIFLGVRNPVSEVARISGRPCTYLPMAADVERFAPYPQFPERVIDICSIGRRSEETHRALIQLADERKIFYYYDTVASSGLDLKQRTFRVQSANEHRLLFANLLRRSRYYVANRALVNDPSFTQGREEISGRFYEGAAGGTVMVGEPPQSEDFNRQFDWDGAVVHIPFDSPDVGRIIGELERDPVRISRIRRDNFYNAALRHDWVYRVRTVFETLGLPLTPALLARERRLQSLATESMVAWPRAAS